MSALSRRRWDYDLLRVASMVGVVYLHTAAGALRQLGTPLWHFSNLLSSLATAAVPLFFMLSAAHDPLMVVLDQILGELAVVLDHLFADAVLDKGLLEQRVTAVFLVAQNTQQVLDGPLLFSYRVQGPLRLQLALDGPQGISGEFPNGAMTLRAKIDLASGNFNMRDPVLYRINHMHHHRQGDKWCIYPMYDFAHPLEDALEGITHSLCSLEFEDHRPLYDWVIANCPVPARPRPGEQRHGGPLPGLQPCHSGYYLPTGKRHN